MVSGPGLTVVLLAGFSFICAEQEPGEEVNSFDSHYNVRNKRVEAEPDLAIEEGRKEKNWEKEEEKRKKEEEKRDREALSRNVTRILEDLLKDYDKTERPAYSTGGVTPVKVNILIRSMGPISEANMYYSMDCYFRQYWRDQRLSFRVVQKSGDQFQINQLSLNVKMLEKIWKPDTYFHNGLGSYLHTITRPNKLLRISEDGDITYSMRLTIKAKCPMSLMNFPMDQQSCPLVFGSFAYTADEVEYKWQSNSPVGYEGELQLSQFDIKNTVYRSLNFTRSESVGTYSVLQVVFLLQRNSGYYLIQVYLPCSLIVVLSWVGFWLNREATSDRVTLGVTAVLTLSAIALDSRTDLPKVHYATALDWFIICSFGYCMASLLEFAGVHYFTKVGSGEAMFNEEEDEDSAAVAVDWDDLEDWKPAHKRSRLRAVSTVTPTTPSNHIAAFNNIYGLNGSLSESTESIPPLPPLPTRLYNNTHHTENHLGFNSKEIHENGGRTDCCIHRELDSQDPAALKGRNTPVCGGKIRERERAPSTPSGNQSGVKAVQTQTEKSISLLRQLLFCLAANVEYRRERERSASSRSAGTINSVSKIDSVSRVLFPLTFVLFNVIYWHHYFKTTLQFNWGDHSISGNKY